MPTADQDILRNLARAREQQLRRQAREGLDRLIRDARAELQNAIAARQSCVPACRDCRDRVTNAQRTLDNYLRSEWNNPLLQLSEDDMPTENEPEPPPGTATRPRCTHTTRTYRQTHGAYINEQCRRRASADCPLDSARFAYPDSHLCALHCDQLHITCGNCNRHFWRSDGSCGLCNTCLDCCDALVCESCGYRDHNAEICDECGSLTTCGCCRCNGTARTDSIGRRYGEPGKPWVADIKARKGFNSTRLIGFEYEFNHAQSYSQIGEACARWRAGWHTDGSCGEEVVSAPISGDHIAGCLTDLCKALRRSNAEVNSSCSMHVHVDARDFHWVDVYRLLRVYAYLEPVLYMLGGQSRVRNSYCRPVGAQYVQALRATDIKAAIMGVAFGDGAARVRQTQRSRPGKKGGVRYQGLNLLPWLAGRRSTGRHKPDTTIEFRIHRNVEPQNYNRAIHWCQTLARIVDWVAKASEKDLEALPRSPLRGLATVIAPDQKEWIIQRVREWRAATSFSRDRLRLRRYQPRHFTVRGGMGFTFAPTWAHLRALDPLKNPIVLRSQILTRATPKQTKIKQRAA